MKTADLTIDRMPGITWRWLRLNDRRVSFSADGTAAEPVISGPDGITVTDGAALPALDAGAGKDFEQFIEGASSCGIDIPAGVKESAPVRLNFDFADGSHTLNRYGITVGGGSEATVIMDFRSAADAAGSAGIQTKIKLEDGALLHFVQIHRAGDSFHIINDLGAATGEKARIEVIHVIFSGKEVDIGSEIILHGDDSSADMQVGYIVRKDHQVDLSYLTPYIGKRGTSNLNVSGVLCDEAKKIFRGTIDFRKGCTDSVGDENESVLLMDDHVVNQSVPTILCDEENVEGNHGASIGKVDEELMFYMMTRGISYDEIYAMMAKAKLEAIFRQIPDRETVEELLEYNETCNG
ncbi:MAG: SufB/SufD family protein [Acutalibacteraceae bacterium]